eukprot:gene32049-40509_t
MPSTKNARDAIKRKQQEDSDARTASRTLTEFYLEKGRVLNEAKDYEEAIAVLQKAVDVDPENSDKSFGSIRPYVYYALACVYSCSGDLDAALENLSIMIKLGVGSYRIDFAQEARKDPDLKNVREDPRFEEEQ